MRLQSLDKDRERRMVFYGRVSTEQEAQLSALKNQMQWYDDQLQYHKNWTCINKYIDEGITGTQAKKRPAFLRMIEDAKRGKFDLIVTREVSRFARNTVETLQFTRDLKNKYNVEVFFIEDNIWTMDGDGELRLTIMATLAQEESRKTSERVKAGQKISRDNGVLYGNGNILGYEKVGNTYVINEEQAETVRIIYDLYLKGLSAAKIRNELCKQGRKTAAGKTTWYSSVIIQILKNTTYKGVMRYGQSYSNNYLEQKRYYNYDTDTYEYKEGSFPPIIPIDIWDRVQEIMASKTKPSKNGEKTIGSKLSTDVWMRKLKCACGSSMAKNKWRVSKAGIPSYGYQCNKQRNIGSKKFREQNGLDTEGYCDIPMVADWKLSFMAKEIIASIWSDRRASVERAYEMIASCYTEETEDIDKQIDIINGKIQENQNRINNLIAMRTDNEITKDEFIEMRGKYDDKIMKLRTELDELLSNDHSESKSEIEKQLKEIRSALDETIDFYIWDTAGQDHFNAITRRYYRGADACLIVFAINDKESFIQVKSWHKKMTNECGDIPTALVMSKIDLKAQRKISDEEAEKLAKELNIKLFNTSSKDGVMVEECFEYLAEKNYQKKGNASSGAENIEDVRNGIKFIHFLLY